MFVILYSPLGWYAGIGSSKVMRAGNEQTLLHWRKTGLLLAKEDTKFHLSFFWFGKRWVVLGNHVTFTYWREDKVPVRRIMVIDGRTVWFRSGVLQIRYLDGTLEEKKGWIPETPIVGDKWIANLTDEELTSEKSS